MTKKNSDQVQIHSSHQTTSEDRVKAMRECLKVAEQIRRQLAGREHSDSTELAAEDRQR